ncbi:MAG TPA: hypothetical protein VFK48_05955 [Usitatibacter sp.]|nr:hypothetical protein [Usitatibacter sp.]
MEIDGDLRRLLRRDASMDAREAARVWGAILDAGVDDIEVGAAVAVLALTGETEAELAGLHRAVMERRAPWSPGARGVIAIPAYGLVPGEAAWIALVAMLLRRFDVPVAIHGVLDSPCGMSSARVLRELGVLPCASLGEATERLHRGGIAFVPAQLLLPAFARLIGLRARLGMENSAHVVAQAIDPLGEGAIRMTFSLPGGASERLGRLDAVVEGTAVALAWPVGSSTVHVGSRPRIERLHAGRRETLFEADGQEVRHLAAPADDARGLGAWTHRVASGTLPVPTPALNLVAACLYAAGHAGTLSQAKAVAAIEAGRLAA